MKTANPAVVHFSINAISVDPTISLCIMCKNSWFYDSDCWIDRRMFSRRGTWWAKERVKSKGWNNSTFTRTYSFNRATTIKEGAWGGHIKTELAYHQSQQEEQTEVVETLELNSPYSIVLHVLVMTISISIIYIQEVVLILIMIIDYSYIGLYRSQLSPFDIYRSGGPNYLIGCQQSHLLSLWQPLVYR